MEVHYVETDQESVYIHAEIVCTTRIGIIKMFQYIFTAMIDIIQMLQSGYSSKGSKCNNCRKDETSCLARVQFFIYTNLHT